MVQIMAIVMEAMEIMEDMGVVMVIVLMEGLINIPIHILNQFHKIKSMSKCHLPLSNMMFGDF